VTINILCIGDIVGPAGRGMLADHLHGLIAEHNVDLVVCNAENAAGGSGLTPQLFQKLLRYGVDVVTLGDHCFRKSEIIKDLKDSDRILRPANLTVKAPGRRWTLVPTKSGAHQVAVVCLLGQMFMGSADSPWAAADDILAEIGDQTPLRVVDFHAEATSEKVAVGWHLNGRASIVFGTHTHVPTADARVLDKGTAHVSDLGMTGPYESVLGRKADCVLGFLTTGVPRRFDLADGDPRLVGLLTAVDAETGRAESVEVITILGRAESEAAD
jgi:metallophosphoesterase (TIGR00282 family)